MLGGMTARRDTYMTSRLSNGKLCEMFPGILLSFGPRRRFLMSFDH